MAFVVTVAQDGPDDARQVSNEVKRVLTYDKGVGLARGLNATGALYGGMARSVESVGRVTYEAADSKAALALAQALMRASIAQSALAADGDAEPVPWSGQVADVYSKADSSYTDAKERRREFKQAQRDAAAATAALVASGSASGANYKTTVAQVARAAEAASAAVMNISLGAGEDLNTTHYGGTHLRTWVSDVHGGGHWPPSLRPAFFAGIPRAQTGVHMLCIPSRSA